MEKNEATLVKKPTFDETRVKIVLVGDKEVGKTSFLISYTSNSFPLERSNSIFNNYTTNLKFQNKVVKIDFWELPAGEDYQKMRKINYPQSDIFLIMFSCINPLSFNNAINKWLPEIKLNDIDNNPIIFIANKIDLRAEETDKSNILTHDYLQQKLGSLGKQYAFFESSCLTQIGLTEICNHAVKMVLEKRNPDKDLEKRDNCCNLI